MKNKLSKFLVTTTVLALGIGVITSINKNINKVEATQHTANYSAYTYSGSYYDNIDTTKSDGMQGDFRKSLTSLIYPKGFCVYSSKGSDHLSTVLQSADEDPTNSSNMVYFYTRDSVKKNAASSWNREHVWPQSLSNNNWGTGEAGTDLLHIRPTYYDTNEARGNLVYGNVGKANPQKYNNMTWGYMGGNLFEPLDEVKGDVARIIMYVWTTYYDHYYDLNGSKIWPTNTIESYETLIKWHTLDKPDALEGNRNNYAETSKQKNRNPFVDHPEYAWKIFGDKVSSDTRNACMEAYPMGGGITTNKNLIKIDIAGQANKTSYNVGDSFDPTGLTITGTYDDDSNAIIPASNCFWAPDPLTEGTTSVTCSYNGITAIYQGITVTKKEVPANAYVVEFKKNSADGSAELDGAKIFSTQIASNNLIKGIGTTSKIFDGKEGLKMGSQKANGEIQLMLADDAKNDITRIEIESSQYNTSSASLSLKINSEIEVDSFPVGTKFSKEIDSKSAVSITISTIGGRAYLGKVTVYVGKNEEPPISSSSEVPSSSSEIPSSSSEIPSSSETSESSSVISSEESISSSEIAVSSQIENPEPQEDSGCNGSIISALSLTSISALIGLVFAFSKKKKI